MSLRGRVSVIDPDELAVLEEYDEISFQAAALLTILVYNASKE